MASTYKRQLPPTAIPQGFKQTDQQAGDYGAYRVLEIYMKILKAGPAAGTVFLSHNATLDPDNWRAITNATIAQDGVDAFVPVTDFLRYVRVEGNESGTGACIALIDIVGKE